MASALCGLPVVPTTSAPSAVAQRVRIWPTPPAAAWTRIRSPGFTGQAARSKYCAVSPLNSSVAADSSLTPSGSGTSRSAATLRASA